MRVVIDPDGEWVDVPIPDDTGLTTPGHVRLTAEDVDRIHRSMRAAQLGADARGDL